MRGFGNSLTAYFTTMILAILIVGQGILYGWLMLYQKGYLEERLKSEVAATAEHIRDMLATSEHDYKQMDVLLGAIIKKGVFLSIKIIDKEGNTLAVKTAQVKEIAAKGINPFFMFYTPDMNTLSLPMASGGAVEIVYSGTTVNEVMRRFLVIPPIMQFITFLVIILAIIKFFQKKVGKPVKRINDALVAATAGDLTAKISGFKDDEIGSIAEGCRFLIDRLGATLNKLRSMSEDVSMAISQLTLTFKNVTQSIQQQAESINTATTLIKQAGEAQDTIMGDSGKLIDFSNENVTSLLEIKATAEEITSSTGRLFKATEDAYSVVAQISQTAKAVAANSEETSASVEETSASVEELNASVKEIESSAKESTRLAANTRVLLGGQCLDAVSDAINGMDNLLLEVKQSSEIMKRLSNRSADIEKMLGVIKDVTEKTNLLSLNAAILAAQAGEYGKSFSVVADEIRALSDRTATSTKEIANIVKAIQSEISEAVTATGSSMNRVNETNELVLKAGVDMAKALEAAQTSATMANTIERATEEQAKGLNQISISIENVRKMIIHMTKATQEQQAGTSRLLENVSDVRDVADIVKHGTEEEAAGIKAISNNFELADEKIGQIGRSMSNQKKISDDIMAAMEQMRTIGMATVRDVEDVSHSLSTLYKEIEALKKEMETFKTQ